MVTNGSLEIEHKFVVEKNFDKELFFSSVRALKPQEEFTSHVTDTYFFKRTNPQFVLRHRIDDRIQQFTVKSLGRGNNAVRTEVNLDLARSTSSQIAEVTSFCAVIGVPEKSVIAKQVHVFEFEDVEIVLYVASNERQSICCVEFESIERSNVERGLATIQKYEKILGFDERQREGRSLFELFVLPELS